MKTGLVAATGVAGLSTASFAQNNENSNYVITLTAVDQDGNPLQGKATVIGSADGDIIGERELDEDGQATWEVSQEGEYSYNVYDIPGYEEASEDTSFEVDGDTDITAEMETEDSQADDENTITVTVRDENDDPVGDANVSVVVSDGGDEIASGDTDSDGTVSFDIESGEYDVIVNHDDVIGPASTSVTVDDGDTDVSVTLDTTNGRATGIIRVVDQNGDPVKGEPVTVWPPGTVEEDGTETHETNADGEVVIELRSFEPTDVTFFDVEVRDQEQTLGIMSDAENGVQETVFEVETSDEDGNDSTDDGDSDAGDDNDEGSTDDGDSDDSDDEDDNCAKAS
ncbi:carboxypeptidase-like regulatory domain-containing protein [Halalkalicoccus paucihalophilus]|uniref:carboxypeptidase-like regulatory domain-containing protein n=1 Tax=Halalkalicoccus paucihalophilus TaxID=1008153 RepID=UPI000834A914|nr:carboxypeptidase-like regulatory domain-containing protein [Halalkalicoccus paucihalophilus]